MRTPNAAFQVGLAVAALFAAALALAHGGGLDANGGHTDRRTGEYHQHRGPGANAKADDASGCSERPDYNPKLDVRHMQRHGWIAPYNCRTVASAQDVDIEHIVAWAEARRSGLSCGRASEFMNDPLNITVAYPRTNRHQKSDKDAAQWLPAHNRCWFAARVVTVKRKYGLETDAAEQAALDRVLASCSAADRAASSCPAR